MHLSILAAFASTASASTVIDLPTLSADYEAKNGETLTGTLAANLLFHSGLLKILGANGTEDYLYLVAVQDVIDQYEFSAMDHSDCKPIQLSV